MTICCVRGGPWKTQCWVPHTSSLAYVCLIASQMMSMTQLCQASHMGLPLACAGLLVSGNSRFSSKVRIPMFEGFFQPMHLLVIVGLALLMFGPKKLPELGKGIGSDHMRLAEVEKTAGQ